jgi:hypothetical protein
MVGWMNSWLVATEGGWLTAPPNHPKQIEVIAVVQHIIRIDLNTPDGGGK